MSDYTVRFTQKNTNTSKVDEDELFIVRFVQHTGNLTATSKSDDSFIVRFKQTLPPIYRVTLEVADNLLNQIFAFRVLLDSSVKLLLEKTFDVDAIDLPDNISITSGKKADELLDVIDNIAEFTVQKRINEITNVVDTTLKDLDKGVIDTTEINQQLIKLFSTSRTDIAEVDSQVLLNSAKVLLHETDINDLLEKTIGKRFENEVEFIDEFIRIVEYNRTNEDLVGILEETRSDLAKQIEQKIVNTVSRLFLLTTKSLFSISEVIDQKQLSITKTESSNTAAASNTNLEFDKTRLDEIAIQVNKFIDFDKKLSSSTETFDQLTNIILEKVLNSGVDVRDTTNVNLDSEQAIIVNKSTSDIARIADVIEILLTVIRSFDDLVNTFDGTSIDFAKIVTDSTNTLDVLKILQSKLLENTSDLEDDTAVDFTKITADSSVTLDTLSSLFEKTLLNTAFVDDQEEKDFGKAADSELETADQEFRDFMKSISDMTSLLVEIKFEQEKLLRDEAVTFEDSNIFDGSLFNLQKSIASKAYIAENILLLVSTLREFFDVAEIEENLSIDLSRIITDEAAAQELITLIVSYIRAFNDQSTIEDTKLLNFVKGNNELPTATDEEILSLQKVFNNNTTALETITLVLNAIRSLDDESLLNDQNVLSIVKAESDSVSILEEIFVELVAAFLLDDGVIIDQSIELVYTKELTDTNIAMDLLSLVLFGVQLENVDTLSDTLKNFNKTVLNEVSSLSIIRTALSKQLSSNTAPTEVSTISFDKFLDTKAAIADEITVELIVLEPIDLESIATALEEIFLHPEKFNSDTATTADTEKEIRDIIGSIGEVANIDDLLQIAADYFRELEDEFTQNDFISIETTKGIQSISTLVSETSFNFNKTLASDALVELTDIDVKLLVIIDKNIDDAIELTIETALILDKLLSDTVSIPSITKTERDIIGSIGEVANLDDLAALFLSRGLENSSISLDQTFINTNKRINSTTNTEDSGEYFYQSYVKEDYFAEEYVGQKGFF